MIKYIVEQCNEYVLRLTAFVSATVTSNMIAKLFFIYLIICMYIIKLYIDIRFYERRELCFTECKEEISNEGIK